MYISSHRSNEVSIFHAVSICASLKQAFALDLSHISCQLSVGSSLTTPFRRCNLKISLNTANQLFWLITFDQIQGHNISSTYIGTLHLVQICELSFLWESRWIYICGQFTQKLGLKKKSTKSDSRDKIFCTCVLMCPLMLTQPLLRRLLPLIDWVTAQRPSSRVSRWASWQPGEWAGRSCLHAAAGPWLRSPPASPPSASGPGDQRWGHDGRNTEEGKR